jgi:hypothetical protein
MGGRPLDDVLRWSAGGAPGLTCAGEALDYLGSSNRASSLLRFETGFGSHSS